MSEIREFSVSDADVGTRLDKFLATQMPDFSRSEIQRFAITVNGTVARQSARMRAGDVVAVTVVTPPSARAADNLANDFDLDILFEDDDIIVINKPRGVVMYPSAGNKTGTLVQNLLSYTHLSGLGGDVRPGVVHRLDKDTSGVMVFAKSDFAFRELVKIFSNHDIVRKYTCFVWGVPSWGGADITGNIARSNRNRQKMMMVKVGGKPAHTQVTVTDAWPRAGVSQFQCKLLTGRTHQIRVHLSSHGFHILCDPLYHARYPNLGEIKDKDLLNFVRSHSGQMLHAHHLEFVHPRTGEKMHFRAPLPDDMLELRCILDNVS